MEKLSYLDALKSNMGDEMAEMMSQEITRVMEQQRHLEKEYARLVTLRSELKGLSNKHKLQDIRVEILVSTATTTSAIINNLNVLTNYELVESGKRAEGFNTHAMPTVAG